MIKRKDRFAFRLADETYYSDSLKEASKYVVSDIGKWLKDLDKLKNTSLTLQTILITEYFA